jgi:hypothetical protein
MKETQQRQQWIVLMQNVMSAVEIDFAMTITQTF